MSKDYGFKVGDFVYGADKKYCGIVLELDLTCESARVYWFVRYGQPGYEMNSLYSLRSCYDTAIANGWDK